MSYMNFQVSDYFEPRQHEGKTYRTMLLRLGIHKVARVSYYTQNHFRTSQWSWLILYGFDSGKWPIDLYEGYVTRLIFPTSEPTLRSSDSLPSPKLHGIVAVVLDRLLTVIANVRLDNRQPPKGVRPIVGAMAGSHNRIAVDEPACSHHPRGVLVLASEAKKQFDNSLNFD